MNSKKDLKLFFAIILWNLLPSVYFLVRMHIVKITGTDINIMGQMEWFDLINETISISLVTPMYFYLKKGKSSSFYNFKIAGILFSIYLAFSVIVALRVGSIAKYMNAEYADRYLLLQTFAMTIEFGLTLIITLFILNEKKRVFYILTATKLILLGCSDFIIIPLFKENGAAYSQITVNFFVFAAAFFLAVKGKVISFRNRGETSPTNIKQWCKTGIFPAMQILLDNIVYMLVIMKMVNAVGETGNYWLANEFIYGWLLIPVFALAEIVKKNKLEKLNYLNTWRPCAYILLFWIASFSVWGKFIQYGMSMDSKKIMPLVVPMMAYYVTFLISAVIDAWFVSINRTVYMTVISAVVNIGYYGIVYSLFKAGNFTYNMNFIINMFGIGMAVHLICSIILYKYEIKRSIIE